mgnify:CR=1 FL=1
MIYYAASSLIDWEITARALSLLLQPLNFVVSSLFLNNREMRARACRCSDPLLSGAINKKIISTGISSEELKSNPLTSVDTKT